MVRRPVDPAPDEPGTLGTGRMHRVTRQEALRVGGGVSVLALVCVILGYPGAALLLLVPAALLAAIVLLNQPSR
jgi:hypothetical protein